jgi:hypothetical protein
MTLTAHHHCATDSLQAVSILLSRLSHSRTHSLTLLTLTCSPTPPPTHPPSPSPPSPSISPSPTGYLGLAPSDVSRHAFNDVERVEIDDDWRGGIRPNPRLIARASTLHVAGGGDNVSQHDFRGSDQVDRDDDWSRNRVEDTGLKAVGSYLSLDGTRNGGLGGGSHSHIFRDTERVDLDDDWSGRAGGLGLRGPDGSEHPLGESTACMSMQQLHNVLTCFLSRV